MNERDVDALLAAVPATESHEGHIDDGHLLAYHRCEASDEDVRQLEEHLAECAECRARLVELAAPAPDALLRWAESQGTAATRRSSVRSGRWSVATAAVAAGILVMVALPNAAHRYDEYALEGPFGGIKDTRGARAEPQQSATFAPNTTVEVVLRPARRRAVGETPDVRVYIESPAGGPVKMFSGSVTTSPGGGVLFSADADTLFTEGAGAYRLFFVLRPPRHSGPTEFDSAEALLRRTEDDKRFEVRVRFAKIED